MTGKRAYRCGRCGERKLIPGWDRNLPAHIRTGCHRCEAIRRHWKQGIPSTRQLFG